MKFFNTFRITRGQIVHVEGWKNSEEVVCVSIMNFQSATDCVTRYWKLRSQTISLQETIEKTAQIEQYTNEHRAIGSIIFQVKKNENILFL
jgi:hypothetical protein